jgi:hypothetical protein
MAKLIELGLPSLTPGINSILASQGTTAGIYNISWLVFLFLICVPPFGFDALFLVHSSPWLDPSPIDVISHARL